MKKRYLIILVAAVFLIFGLGCRPKAEREPIPNKGQPQVGQATAQLPPAVTEAINKYFAGAEVGSVETEEVDGITLYDLEFKDNRGEIEVAEDGTVIDLTTIVTWEDLPLAAAITIKKVVDAAGATVTRLEKAEVQAEVKQQGGTRIIVKIAPPVFLYEAELSRDSQKGEVQVDPEGKIIEGPKWEAKGN